MPISVLWHAWCLYFGVLGDPGTIRVRSWDDPGTLEGTRRDPARSRLGFYRFFGDLGDQFNESFGYSWTKREDFFISISRLFFLMVFGSEITSTWRGMSCEKQLAQKLDFLRFQGLFFMFLGGLGTNFHGFCCLEAWLEN